MTCKPKHKTLRAALGFGMPGYDPYSFGVMQNAQNNAATRFANSSYDWAAADRNMAQQNNLFDQGLKSNQFGLQRDQFGLQSNAQNFSQGLQRDMFGASRQDARFNQGLQQSQQDFSQGFANRQFDASRTDATFNQGMANRQFDASRQDKALDNTYRASRENRTAQDFNRAQAAMSQPRPAMTPYRFGLRNGGEIHAAMGFNYAVPDAPERVPGWVDEFNAKGQGQYVGRDKAKANEYAVAKRNAETTDRMANGGAYPGAVGLDAARNPYKRVQQLENMYDDSGYNPYTGIYNEQKKGAGAQWLAGSKYRMKDGGTLRTGAGGVVPGTGKGDKIRAKYEPGEFVVSNDMLAADPALLPHLRELRKAVLAQKGMTPEQADAKAIHMDSEGPGDERGAKDEKEPKSAKRGFGIRASGGGEYLPIDIQRARDAIDMTPEDAMRMRLNDEARNARGSAMRAKEPVVHPEDAAEAAYQRSRVERGAQESKARLGNLYEPPAKPVSPEYKTGAYGVPGAEDVPKQPVAPTQNVDKANASTQPATTPATKDSAPMLQGATGQNVGFGITRFNVPGQSPLFTNMTDAAGMASNDALLSRKPQSEQDRIAGDNLSNRFAQRADAEARMAQRQAELNAEYQRGLVDNRAIDSRARQTELAKEIENLNTHLGSRNLTPEEYRRGEKQLELLQTARLNEGSGFGLHETQLAINSANNASNFGIHAADNASREKMAADKMALERPGEALKQQMNQAIFDAQNLYANAKTPEEKAATEQNLRAVLHKFPEAQKPLVVDQPDTTTSDGTTKLGGGQKVLVQTKDGRYVYVDPVSAQPNTQQPNRPVGTTSTVNGQSARWDGSKWVRI